MKQNFSKALERHKKLNGKIEVSAKVPILSPKDLKIYYTPGVGEVSRYLAAKPKEVWDYTIKKNTVAVISDGSAVLGLGNIGPEAALPVMEGKAMIFKEFADVNAFPIVLNTQNVDEIVATVKNIAPVFGAINLEDISAPRCFELEAKLQNELDIFVMHDDQHATAIAVLAGIINAFKVVGKSLQDSSIAMIGAGAAGNAVVKILCDYGVKNILVVDRKGIISKCRPVMLPHQLELANITNEQCKEGSLEDALRGADAVIGLSGPGIIKPEYVKNMAKNPIVFALANPVPEIMPDLAKKAGAMVIATGRSDFPNQVNNSLVFPGIFKGALQYRIKRINNTIKIRVAERLAGIIKKPTAQNIIPSMFDGRVVKVVAAGMKK